MKAPALLLKNVRRGLPVSESSIIWGLPMSISIRQIVLVNKWGQSKNTVLYIYSDPIY